MNHNTFTNPLDNDHMTQGEFRRSLPELRRLLDGLIEAIQGLQRQDVEKNGSLQVRWVNGSPIYSLDNSTLLTVETDDLVTSVSGVEIIQLDHETLKLEEIADGTVLISVLGQTSFVWRYITNNTMADPGSGQYRTNTTGFSTATQIALDIITDDGTDVSQFLKTLRSGDTLALQDKGNAANWARYTLSAAPTNNTTWFLLPLTFVGAAGTVPTNNTKCVLTFYEAGAGGGGAGTISVSGPNATGTTTTLTGINTLAVIQVTVLSTSGLSPVRVSTGGAGIANVEAHYADANRLRSPYQDGAVGSNYQEWQGPKVSWSNPQSTGATFGGEQPNRRYSYVAAYDLSNLVSDKPHDYAGYSFAVLSSGTPLPAAHVIYRNSTLAASDVYQGFEFTFLGGSGRDYFARLYSTTAGSVLWEIKDTTSNSLIHLPAYAIAQQTGGTRIGVWGTTPSGHTVCGGIITAIGAGGGGGAGTVTSITAGAGLSGGVITTTGTIAVIWGTVAGTSCQGNDSRLSDARTPIGTTLAAANIWVGSAGSVAAAVGVTGDVALTSLGVVTVGANAISYAKMQDVSAASKLLGRGDSGSGDPQEITLGTGLTMTGTTLSATGGGTGTVTSVALTMPGIFSVAGSPVTTSGTLAVTLTTETANTVWAGPSSGAAAVPTFRAIGPSDLGLAGKGDLLTVAGSGAFTLQSVGSNGQVLTADSAQTSGMKWSTPTAGTGTVTSVALAMPGIFSVSGSPVTTSGTLTAALATQSANLVWAGPTSGAAAAPAFRGLVANDLPVIPGMLLGTPKYIQTEETTTSTSYVDLNSANPESVSFSVPAGTHDVLVMYSAFWGQDVINAVNYNEVFLDGTGQAGSEHFNGIPVSRDITTICNYLLTGVSSSGNPHTVTIKHKVGSGNGYWKNRMVTVWLAS